MKQPQPQTTPPPANSASGGTAHAARLRKLFEDHNRALHSFLLMKLGGNEQEAQEVAQEAYARLLQLHDPGAVSLLQAYLFKTAANIAIDRARQRSTRTRFDEVLHEEPIDANTPDRCVLAAEELEVLEKALHELPPKYRRAFVLHRFEEWSTERIGRELGVQPRMVRNYISRAVIYCKLRLQGLSAAAARDEVMP